MSFSLTDRVPLGKSGLSVPRVSFGTAGLGNMPETFGFSVSEEDAAATLAAVFKSPINSLDTARNYGMGEAERRIGIAIKANGGLPKDFKKTRMRAPDNRQKQPGGLMDLALDKIGA